MKKNYILGGITLVLVLIYVSLFAFTYKPDSIKFKNEYEKLNTGENAIKMNIDKNNTIKYASVDKVFDILENGTGIIYFGFPSCPWCRSIVPVLLDVAKQENKTVYYFNPRAIREKGDKDYNKLIELLSNYLDTDEDGHKKLYVPDVYFVKNGNIVGHHLGSISSQEDPRMPLTDEQTQELKNIFLELITKIK